MMELNAGVFLREGERLDDLQTAGFHILQNPALFRFGSDSVLLAHFAHAKPDARWIDLGTGTGVLALLLLARYPSAHIEAVELQAAAADMAGRSMALNGVQEQIHVHQMDMRQAPAFFGAGAFDAAICNPPYGKRGSALLNPSDALSIARHEVSLTLSEVIANAAALLRNGGSFFIAHRAERFCELVTLLSSHRLEPKRVCFLQARPGQNAKLVLVEARKLGKPGVVVLPPLILYNENGTYSPEVLQLYNGAEL